MLLSLATSAHGGPSQCLPTRLWTGGACPEVSCKQQSLTSRWGALRRLPCYFFNEPLLPGREHFYSVAVRKMAYFKSYNGNPKVSCRVSPTGCPTPTTPHVTPHRPERAAHRGVQRRALGVWKTRPPDNSSVHMKPITKM